VGEFGGNGIHRGRPNEGLRGLVPRRQEFPNCLMQFFHAKERSAARTLGRQFSKPHQVQKHFPGKLLIQPSQEFQEPLVAMALLALTDDLALR